MLPDWALEVLLAGTQKEGYDWSDLFLGALLPC